LDEISYNLKESQDFFQAGIDGRLKGEKKMTVLLLFLKEEQFVSASFGKDVVFKGLVIKVYHRIERDIIE
jgi:hypothetical protein